jgi:ATP-dependent HslUV protease, peptidase subunit HslV
MITGNEKIRSTTILGVRIGKIIALGGDGQVTFGDMKMKSKAKKVREFSEGKVLAGFAGAAADAMALFEKFESKLEETEGDLQKAVVEMAKEWRTDKVLRELDALLAIIDNKHSYLLSGSGDVIEPDGNIITIGSGSGYALAAARAFIKSGEKNPSKIVRDSLKITSDICIYTNDHITILESK